MNKVELLYAPSYETALKISSGKHIDKNDVSDKGIPFLPKNLSMVFVSGFGNTLKEVNGIRKQDEGFDWYYKGNGNVLRKDGDYLVLPLYGLWGGLETEILMVHLINENLEPVYLGYTLAIDFTNTGLRRRNKSLKNLSHISQTMVANEIATSSFPEYDIAHTNITRGGKVIWNSDASAGKRNMWMNPKKLINFLFRNKEILLPGMIFYTLTGATMSSDKAGIHLKKGDKINSYLSDESIFLESIFDEK
ncbi:hypothetical protein PS423_01955 [Pediococcus acidilactici]|uniref:hypothetical protein n=1 Tax=Pediococcus acidilactici TaxID=1254 RepID=UPI002F2633EF